MANKTCGIIKGGVPAKLMEGQPRPKSLNPLGIIRSRSIRNTLRIRSPFITYIQYNLKISIFLKYFHMKVYIF